jgi:hypothetical protein
MKRLSSLFLISFSLFLLIGQASDANAYSKRNKRQKNPTAQSPAVDYSVISLRRVANESEVEQALDKAGKEGWILVSVIEGVQANRLYIFKKMYIFDNSPQLIKDIATIKQQVNTIVENTKPKKTTTKSSH